jgi:hypothetical protein
VSLAARSSRPFGRSAQQESLGYREATTGVQRMNSQHWLSKWIPNRIIVACVALAATAPTLAHHSRLTFDMSQNIALRGIVKEYRWENPHSHIVIAVAAGAPDPSTVGTWDIEASSISIMTSRGFKPNTFKAGDPITVVVHPDKTGSNSVLLFYVINADGSRLYRATNRYPLEKE